MPLTLVAPPLAQLLKTETARVHRETEAILLPVLQNVQSLAAYAAILKTMYGFHAPLEAMALPHLHPSLLPDAEQRKRSAMILHDLAAVGVNERPPLCSQVPPVKTAAQAFGVLYVLEGSTLGGKYIAAMLRKNAAVSIPGAALRFFEGYGPQTGPMWTSFVEALNGQANTAEVIEAASQTFFSFKTWMQENLSYEASR